MALVFMSSLDLYPFYITWVSDSQTALKSVEKGRVDFVEKWLQKHGIPLRTKKVKAHKRPENKSEFINALLDLLAKEALIKARKKNPKRLKFKAFSHDAIMARQILRSMS